MPWHFGWETWCLNLHCWCPRRKCFLPRSTWRSTGKFIDYLMLLLICSILLFFQMHYKYIDLLGKLLSLVWFCADECLASSPRFWTFMWKVMGVNKSLSKPDIFLSQGIDWYIWIRKEWLFVCSHDYEVGAKLSFLKLQQALTVLM